MLRRATTISVAAAVVASAFLTGSGTASATTPTTVPSAVRPTVGGAPVVTAAARTAAPGTVVMIIRHGEKPKGSAEGVDARGRKDDHSLTAVGWRRARALVGLFDPRGGHLRAGLARPTKIYAAGANEGHEGARTRETVAPLAAELGIPVTTSYGREQEKQLATRVAANGGVTLISWQHKGIPDLVDAFPGVSPTPPSTWPDDRYDVVWTLTRTATGWRFAQLPEMVMPGDHRNVIAG